MKPEKYGSQMPGPIKAMVAARAEAGPLEWKIISGAVHHFLTALSIKKQDEAIRRAFEWAEEDEGAKSAVQAMEAGRDASREETREGKRRRKTGGKS